MMYCLKKQKDMEAKHQSSKEENRLGFPSLLSDYWQLTREEVKKFYTKEACQKLSQSMGEKGI